MDTTDTKKRRDGYNAKRIREILGVKQDDLAERLGKSQRYVSKLEQTDILKDEQLEEIAKALNVPVESILNYSDDAALNIISNSFSSHDSSTLNAINHHCSFNPVDKVVELFERLLKAEQEKIQLLQEVLKEKK